MTYALIPRSPASNVMYHLYDRFQLRGFAGSSGSNLTSNCSAISFSFSWLCESEIMVPLSLWLEKVSSWYLSLGAR